MLPKRLIVQGVAFIPEANLFVTPCTIVKELGKDMQIRFSWNGNRLRKRVVVFIGFSNAIDIINQYADRMLAGGDGVGASAHRINGDRCTGSKRAGNGSTGNVPTIDIDCQ